MVKCRCDVFKCSQCGNGRERIEETHTIDSKINPWDSVTYTESHVRCVKGDEVGVWRKKVYDRAWAAVELCERKNEGKSQRHTSKKTAKIWEAERAEYNSGPCAFFLCDEAKLDDRQD